MVEKDKQGAALMSPQGDRVVARGWTISGSYVPLSASASASRILRR